MDEDENDDDDDEDDDDDDDDDVRVLGSGARHRRYVKARTDRAAGTR